MLGPRPGVGAKPEKKLVDTPAAHPLMDWGTFPHRDEDKGDWKVASWAVEQLQQGPEEPFFLSAGFFLPHVPLLRHPEVVRHVPRRNAGARPRSSGTIGTTPRASPGTCTGRCPSLGSGSSRRRASWKNIVRSYLASTSFVDSQVGRILDALEASGLAENTIVVLWSDHGYHLGEKLITGKNTLWDRSTRVPLIFAGPGVTAGAKSHRPAELLDMYPTLVELAGLPEKSGLEGISLVPQLKDADAPRERPAITTHNHDNHGVRSEDWRYIRYADGSEELYDMRADPNEWHNLAGVPEMAGVLEEHRRWLPSSNAKPAAGSRHRILTYEDGVAVWQGEEIGAEDAIPEI